MKLTPHGVKLIYQMLKNKDNITLAPGKKPDFEEMLAETDNPDTRFSVIEANNSQLATEQGGAGTSAREFASLISKTTQIL